ncbi:MAG: glycosyltransferase [Desulfuromonadales bacterium]|nr:glycosyltransferase [Desulfuromonadales bacterium]
MLKLLIEGLRFVPHSYSCVNMWQCIELLKRNTFELYHNDASICDWNLTPKPGLFAPDIEKSLRSIPPMPDPNKADIIYRIDFPHRFESTYVNRLFVFVTAEFNAFPDNHIAGNNNLRDAHNRSRAIIVTPSAWSRERLIENGADSARVVVIPLGIDPSIFNPLDPEKRRVRRIELGWDNDFVFYNCGCMAPNKGMLTLLKSFAVIARDNQNVRLCLKGLDAVYSSLEFLKMYKESLSPEEKQSMEGRISYLGGSLSFNEMASLYQAADIYVSPYMAEGFNLPVLEAAACGIPVICTQGGPTDEFTLPTFTKYICSRRIYSADQFPFLPDGEHLTQLMQESIEDSDFRARSAVIGPDFINKYHRWQHAVDKLEKILL